MIAVADIIHELQSEGIAYDVDVHVPDIYRDYSENTAEDAIEALLYCGGSTWDSRGQVRPRDGQCDQIGLAANHIMQLMAKTQDCINRCWPEGVERKDVQTVAESFMNTFYAPPKCWKNFNPT